MANNRLYLVCNVCGKSIMLGKDFGKGFSCYRDAREISEFMYDHTFCIDGPNPSHSPGDFTLGYEDLDYCSRHEVVEV